MCEWSISTTRAHTGRLPLVAFRTFRLDGAVSLRDKSRSPWAAHSVKAWEVFENTRKNAWLSGRIANLQPDFVRAVDNL